MELTDKEFGVAVGFHMALDYLFEGGTTPDFTQGEEDGCIDTYDFYHPQEEPSAEYLQGCKDGWKFAMDHN